MNEKFIAVTDKETIESLIAHGLKCVYDCGHAAFFINEPSKVVTFDDINKKKIAYTNTLFI